MTGAVAPRRCAGRRPVERAGGRVLRQVAGRRWRRRGEDRGRRPAIRCAGSSSVARRSRAGEDGALFRFLCASSDSVVRRRRARDASWSRVPTIGRVVGGQLDRRRSARARRVRSHDAHPGLVVVALSPFGLDGPWDDRPTTDFTRQALCGGHVQRGTPGAATAVVRRDAGGVGGGHVRRDRCAGRAATGDTARRIGDLVDVAALDALMYSQPLYPVTWFQIAGEPFRPLRSSQLPSVHPTADGWVVVADDHRPAVARLLRDGRARRLAAPTSRWHAARTARCTATRSSR